MSIWKTSLKVGINQNNQGHPNNNNSTAKYLRHSIGPNSYQFWGRKSPDSLEKQHAVFSLNKLSYFSLQALSWDWTRDLKRKQQLPDFASFLFHGEITPRMGQICRQFLACAFHINIFGFGRLDLEGRQSALKTELYLKFPKVHYLAILGIMVSRSYIPRVISPESVHQCPPPTHTQTQRDRGIEIFLKHL